MLRGFVLAAIVALGSGCGGGSDKRTAAPANGNLIAFTRGEIGSELLYTMNPDGSGQARLAPGRRVDSPDWSPDGKKIAFSRFGPNGEVWVMNSDGTEERQLTKRGKEIDFVPACDCEPAWSPDGKTIAFSTDRGDDVAIWVMNADGSELEKLTSTAEDDSSPTWSADGEQIAFSREQGDGSTEIYVMNGDGSKQRRLTRNAVHDETPAWSPDGRKIAFAHDETDISGPPPHNTEIYVMNSDGSRMRRLTKYVNEDFLPTWSPDGKMIAFVRGTGQDLPEGAIFVMNADGSSPKRLTAGPKDAFPAWRPAR